jgi:hypothetical protein
MENESITDYKAFLDYAITLQIADKTSHEIKRALKEKGLDDDILINRITIESADKYYEIANKAANKNILWGTFWLFIGLCITLATYKSGGKSYILMYGAIISGLFQLLSGLYKKSQL